MEWPQNKPIYLTDGHSIGFNVDVVTLVHRLSVKACVAALTKYLLPVGNKRKQTQHPGRLTCNLQIIHLERKMIFQTFIIMFHANLPGWNSFANKSTVNRKCHPARVDSHPKSPFRCTVLFFPENHKKRLNSLKIALKENANMIFF